MKAPWLCLLKASSVCLLLTVPNIWGQVSFDRILEANKEPQNWLTYSGSLMGQRYSTLTQITPANVKDLELQWVFQAHSLEKYEATPLVVDGILYTVQAPNDVVAIDAVTGRIFWVYEYAPSPEARVCCGRVQGHRRRRRRRVRYSGIPCRLRCAHRQTGLEVQHHSRPGRAWSRNLGR
jgi:glucose dehydrogenase